MAKRKATSAETAAQIEALTTEIAALEDKRQSLLAAGLPTVQAQIDHLTTLVAIHSHASTIARLESDTIASLKHVESVTKLQNEIHKLQRDLVLDRLNELKDRADQQSEAANLLARFRKD